MTVTDPAKAVALPGPTLAEFEMARETVAKVAQITPMEVSRYLGDILGHDVFLKCESLWCSGDSHRRHDG
jgi:threonine dehydratase